MKKTLLSMVAASLFFAGSVALTSCGGGGESHGEEAHTEQHDEATPAAEETHADADAEGEHKCGEGKCGDSADSTAEGEHKCGEGKCGEGKCGDSADSTAEGEHKCGEGKCGEGN